MSGNRYSVWRFINDDNMGSMMVLACAKLHKTHYELIAIFMHQKGKN